MFDKDLLLSVVVFVMVIAFFLLIREIVCWYFKINERIRLQKRALETMLKIYEQNGGELNWEEVNKF